MSEKLFKSKKQFEIVIAIAAILLVTTVVSWSVLSIKYHRTGADWLAGVAILSSVGAIFCWVFVIAEIYNRHKQRVGVIPLIKPGASVLITNNLPVSLPIFEVFDRKSEEHPIFTQTTITTKYKNATLTLIPQSSSPGRNSYETAFVCSGCLRPIPISVKQATVLPIRRSQMGFGKGLHNPLRVGLAIVLSSVIGKFFVLLMCSLFLMPVIYLYTGTFRTSGASGVVPAWGIAAFILAGVYLLYVGYRLFDSPQILLPVRNPRDYGYGNPNCFNIIIWALMTNEKGSVFHATDTFTLNNHFESKSLYSRYKFGLPTWVAIWQ